MAGKGASLRTLAAHVWGKRPASDAVWRKRREKLKRALLEEVGQLDGWAISSDAQRRGVWHISRPKQIENVDDYYFPTPSEQQAFMDSIHESRSSDRMICEEEYRQIQKRSDRTYRHKTSDLSSQNIGPIVT